MRVEAEELNSYATKREIEALYKNSGQAAPHSGMLNKQMTVTLKK